MMRTVVITGSKKNTNCILIMRGVSAAQYSIHVAHSHVQAIRAVLASMNAANVQSRKVRQDALRLVNINTLNLVRDSALPTVTLRGPIIPLLAGAIETTTVTLKQVGRSTKRGESWLYLPENRYDDGFGMLSSGYDPGTPAPVHVFRSVQSGMFALKECRDRIPKSAYSAIRDELWDCTALPQRLDDRVALDSLAADILNIAMPECMRVAEASVQMPKVFMAM